MSQTLDRPLAATIAALGLAAGMLALSVPALAGTDSAGRSSAAEVSQHDEGLEGTGLDAFIGVARFGAFLGSALDRSQAGVGCRIASRCGARGDGGLRRAHYLEPHQP